MDKKPKIDEKMREALRAEFPKEAYSSHPKKTFLTTLKAMYVTERLNDVFGMGRWTIEVETIERTPDYILMQGEFHSLDYDVAVPKQFGGHKTTGKNTEIADGYKSALTDCQSKIASYFEIGIEMFKGNIKPPAKTYPAKKDDGRKWLNENTADWQTIVGYIGDGTITNLNQITKFKVSKESAKKIIMLIEKFK